MTTKYLQQGKDHYFGNGVARSYATAFENFHRAAAADHPEAQFHVALCFEDGDGVKQDPVQAVQWYRKSATGGYAKAQNNLAVCCRNAQGVSRDYAEAEKLYRLAADQGYAPRSSWPTYDCTDHGLTAERLNSFQNPGHMQTMGFYYRFKFDHGAPYEGDAELGWYLREAQRGNADAQCNLGVCYELGLGVPQNLAEAAKWYRSAAERDCPAAQNKLLVGIQSGWIAPLDTDEWWKWYQLEDKCRFVRDTLKGAVHGEATYQLTLGLIYDRGCGVPKDPVEAYKWLSLALTHKIENAAKPLASLEARMTADQINEGNRRVREFRPIG